MKTMSDQWVIRTAADQVKGPYTTEELKNMIVAGQFNGTEEVCEYPQGEWRVLTKQNEFYDALLESLENPAEALAKRKEKMQAETVIQGAGGAAAGLNKQESTVAATQPQAAIPKFDLKEFVEKEIKEQADLKSRQESEKEKKKNADLEKAKEKLKSEKPQPSAAGGGFVGAQPPSLKNNLPNVANNQLVLPPEAAVSKSLTAVAEKNIIEERDKNLEIQMTDLRKLQHNEFKKVAPMLIILAILIGAAAYIFLEEQEPKATGWQLLAPAKGASESLPEEQVKELNQMVLNYCINQVYGEVQGYMKYLYDASTLYTPMEHPVLSYTNDKQLEWKGWF